jgi:hypothetical protein
MVLPDCLEAVWHSRYESRSLRFWFLRIPVNSLRGVSILLNSLGWAEEILTIYLSILTHVSILTNRDRLLSQPAIASMVVTLYLRYSTAEVSYSYLCALRASAVPTMLV